MFAAAPRISLAAYYNAICAARGFGLAPHHYPIVAGLEDDRIENFLVLGPPGTGKSLLFCCVYPTWVLGHEPSLTVLSVSAGEKLPQGFMASCMQIIQSEPAFRRLFPDVRPDPQTGWSIQRGLFVTGHQRADPDASYMSCGLASKALTGLHARLHIYDDIHDRENSTTPEGRSTVKATYYDTLMGRADPRGARRVAVGRWWSPDDLYQEWIHSGDWVVLQLPASRPGNNRLWYDVYVPHGLECVYSETLASAETVQDDNWSYDRYRAYYGAVDPTGEGFYWPDSPSKRREYHVVRQRQPGTAAINYDGDMTGGSEAIFLESDFQPYLPPDELTAGLASPHVRAWVVGMRGELEQAWDTALGQPRSESMTAALTGLLVPCQEWHCGEDPQILGECDFHFDVYLVDAYVEDVDFRDLVLALRRQHAKWSPRRVIVEEKSSGVSLLQTFRGGPIPIHGQKIEEGKVARAVNPVLDGGMPIMGGGASVQGWGRMGRIRYPLGAPWMERRNGERTAPQDSGFLKRVLAYAGGKSGSDEFDTLVHLVTRAIIKSRRHGRVGFNAPVDDLSALPVVADRRREVLEAIGELPGLARAQETPWVGMCGSPCQYYGIMNNREWCQLHDRQTTAIGGCSYWTKYEAA